MGYQRNPQKCGEMAQISVTISDETEKLLEDLAKATGLTKSSLAAEILRRGLYEEASNQTKVSIFRRQKPIDEQT
jgi:predicted DNA-binding protein